MVQWYSTTIANRQLAVAGGISTYVDARLGSKCLVRPFRKEGTHACNWGVQTNGVQNGFARMASQCRSALEALSRQRIESGLVYWLDRGTQPLSFAYARLVGREGKLQDGRGE